MSKLRDIINQKLKQPKQDMLPANLYQLGNGQGVVKVPGTVNRVYVRPIGSLEIMEVLNTRLRQYVDGLPVIVGYTPEEPRQLQVLSVHSGVSDAAGYGAVISAHAPTHRLFDPAGGTDPVWIEGYQVLPGRVGPVYNAVSVTIYPFVCRIGNAWKMIEYQTISLATHVPVITGKAAMVLITVNTSGVIVTTKGVEVDLVNLAPLTDTPAPPTGTAFILAAVRVYFGQTATQVGRTNRDIMDLRFWQQGGSNDSTLNNHAHAGVAGDGGTFDATNLTSGVATDGHVLTADGVGGATWGAISEIIQFSNRIYLLSSITLQATPYNNLLDALNNAASGDAVWLPASVIAGDYTVPANVSLVGRDRTRTILTGKITLSNGSALLNLSVIRTADDATILVGVEGSATGAGHVYNCNISAIQAGSEVGYALNIRGGNLITSDCELFGTRAIMAANGDGHWYSYNDKISSIRVAEAGGVVTGSYTFDSDMDGWITGEGPWNSSLIMYWHTTSMFRSSPGSIVVRQVGSGSPYVLYGGPLLFYKDTDYVVQNGDTVSFWIHSEHAYGAQPRYIRVDYADGTNRVLDTPGYNGQWHQVVLTIPLADAGKRAVRVHMGVRIAGYSWMHEAITHFDDFNTFNIIDIAPQSYSVSGSTFISDPTGVPEPLWSDRSALDVNHYRERHANDIDTIDGIHHTLGYTDVTAAPGDHNHVLDTLLPPTDNTNLNSSITAHGLLPKLSNDANQYLSGVGSWSVPPSPPPSAPIVHAPQHTKTGSDPLLFDSLSQIELTSPASINEALLITSIRERLDLPDVLFTSSLLSVSGTGNEEAAFDGNFTNTWTSPAGTHVLFVTFPTKTWFIFKTIITANSGTWIAHNHPRDWFLHGSNTGAFAGEQVQVLTGTAGGPGIYTTIAPAPRAAYRFYRWTFPARDGLTLQINEIQFFVSQEQAIWSNATPPVNAVSDTTTIDLTLTGQALSANVIPGGIKLDDLGTPDDNTDLNATAERHGLLPKLGGGTSNFLRADGTWGLPPAGGSLALDELTDVVLTTPAGGQVLKYNGTEWVNGTDEAGTPGDPTPTVFVYANTNFI
ncbi:MAG TPA: hypothetical protein VLH56_05250 [Dissulfurispiraceae bacterium]|nr:hypothetical protein [Dissulfurispiraceae bacterium]